LSHQDFLTRVDAVREEITNLERQVSHIEEAHKRVLLSSLDSASAELENLKTQTVAANTRIKDEIRALEIDAKRSPGNDTKTLQAENLKRIFKGQLDKFGEEERNFLQHYREQIKRQFKIVNPDASDGDVEAAADTDWGDEGVFQTAVRVRHLCRYNSG